MSLVSSLLRAIVRADGEVLVLHVGDKPYVVAPTGQVEIAARGLTLAAVTGIVSQLLPAESRAALEEFGAAQHELAATPEFPGERFTVVAARGNGDLWAEIRRRRGADLQEAADETKTASAPAQALADARSDDQRPLDEHPPTPAAPAHEPPPVSSAAPAAAEPIHAAVPSATPVPPAPPKAPQESARVPPAVAPKPLEKPGEQPPPIGSAPPAGVPSSRPKPGHAARAPAYMATRPTPRPAGAPPPVTPSPSPVAPPSVAPSPVAPPPVAPPPVEQAPQRPVAARAGSAAATEPTTAAVVLPLSRNPIRPDAPPPLGEGALSSLDRLLRLGAARGASTLYLASGARPSVRVEGSIRTLEGAPVFDANEVQSLLLTLMPERHAEALRSGVATEWICDLPGVGRIRCLTFRDHRGPGGVFRIMPVRAVTAEQLGLSREIQALALERDGLVLVTGPRASGKRTLMSALVDLINRSRRDHVITIEREIQAVHDLTGSFISQREVRGNGEERLAVARTALREDPDVLVIEELRTAALVNLALDAAANQLVIGCFAAPTASDAIDRIIDLFPTEERQRVQLALAQHLRGVVAQVLLPKSGGGRLAARELLLRTPAVAGLLAEGKTSQLPLAIEGGRAHGMVPLNDAIVGFVQSGAVDVREAYRRSADRAGFLALLKRQGLDTSFAERLA